MTSETDLLDFHWRYFLALDGDVEATLRYVELDKSNYKTFSIEYVRLLFGICSEFEMVCKQLCKLKEPEENFQGSNMEELTEVIHRNFPNISTLEIIIPNLGENIRPLEDWSRFYKDKGMEKRSTPFWWQDYNKVKHERQSNYKRANLKCVIFSLAGLFGLFLYWARVCSKDGRWKIEGSELLEYSSGTRYRLVMPGSPFVLPDFPAEIERDNGS